MRKIYVHVLRFDSAKSSWRTIVFLFWQNPFAPVRLHDKVENSFYEPIIQRLRVERDKRLKHFSGDRRKAA